MTPPTQTCKAQATFCRLVLWDKAWSSGQSHLHVMKVRLPWEGKVLEFETKNEVTSNSQPGADDPYSGNFTYCEKVPSSAPESKKKSFGPVKWRTTDSRGRWIHGGGTGLSDPYKSDRQGWKKTHGCTRAQNEDVKELCRVSNEWVKKNPGKKIKYERK